MDKRDNSLLIILSDRKTRPSTSRYKTSAPIFTRLALRHDVQEHLRILHDVHYMVSQKRQTRELQLIPTRVFGN